MTAIEIAGAVLTLTALAANAADIVTTNEALKIPGVTEQTDFMRWCQQKLGTNWWIPKTAIILFGVALAWLAIMTQPIASKAFALFLLLGLTAAYAKAAFHNIKVKKEFSL